MRPFRCTRYITRAWARKEREMRTNSFVTGVGVILQIAASSASSAQQPATNEPAHKVYVMSGCLEHGSAGTSTFKLAHATAVGQVAPPDAPKDPEAAAGARSYDLLPVASVGEQGLNRETLQSHVGSQVEVTVRPVEVPAGSPGATSKSSTPEAKVDQSPAPRYTVVKIDKVLGSCQVEQR